MSVVFTVHYFYVPGVVAAITLTEGDVAGGVAEAGEGPEGVV